jgi:hypothetical protein
VVDPVKELMLMVMTWHEKLRAGPWAGAGADGPIAEPTGFPSEPRFFGTGGALSASGPKRQGLFGAAGKPG